MAMVPVRESAVNQAAGPGAHFESPVAMMSASEFAVENNDQNRRLLEFLVADLKSNWLPSFQHVTAVIRNIAQCLIAVSSQDLADLRLVCCTKEKESMPGIEYGRREDETIREVAAQCRKLCGAALLDTQNGMDIIDRESNELQATHGPLSRLLREMLSGNTSERTMAEYVQRAQMAHDVIMGQQDQLVQKWQKLNSFVSTISPALMKQLEILESRKPNLNSQRASLKAMYSDAKAHYAELKDREESLREEHQAVVDRYSSEIKELKSARLEIRRLTNEIQLSELLLKKLKIDIKARTSKLEADTASEEKRRAAMAKDTEGQSVTGSLWSSWWSGEGQKRAQMDRDLREQTTTLEEKERERDEITTKLQESKDALELLELRRGQLENEASEDSKALSDESIDESKIQQRQAAAEKALSKVRELKAKIGEVDFEMEKIKKYEGIVPGLCQEFGEMSTHVWFTYDGHKHTLIKLKKYDIQLANIAQRVSSWNRSNVRDVIEDTLDLRCHYIVIRFMSQACRVMCRDLFTDGFLTIAHLGTRPGGEVGQHNLSPRDIQHNTASRDIDRIYRQGELIARAFDNVKGGMQIGDDKIALKFREAQNHCFATLRYAINDIIESTPPRSLWVSSASRLRNWTEKSRRKVVGDWATRALKPKDDDEDVHELPAEQFAKISELPGHQRIGG